VRAGLPTREAIEGAFRAVYAERYGQVPAGRAVEIVTLRVRRVGRGLQMRFPAMQGAVESDPVALPTVDPSGTRAALPAATRAALSGRGEVAGPLLLIDPEATVFVPANWMIRVDPAHGAAVLSRSCS
jgi:N-methylhydantoinase A/oxoprolinase/acetone carboxylase beta subunit